MQQFLLALHLQGCPLVTDLFCRLYFHSLSLRVLLFLVKVHTSLLERFCMFFLVFRPFFKFGPISRIYILRGILSVYTCFSYLLGHPVLKCPHCKHWGDNIHSVSYIQKMGPSCLTLIILQKTQVICLSQMAEL